MPFILFIILVIGIIGVIIYFAEPSFAVRKTRIMNLYSSLLSDMNLDYRSNDTAATNVVEIGKSILNFSREITDINHPEKLSEAEQKWLTDIITEFTDALDLWMNRHADELNLVAEKVENQETDLIEGRSALELAGTRLEVQIGNLRKAEALI
jgi:hypothetical protein